VEEEWKISWWLRNFGEIKNDYIFCGNLRKEWEVLGILGYSTNF
jgi:hypothetical protein